jgi:hypothetical protein
MACPPLLPFPPAVRRARRGVIIGRDEAERSRLKRWSPGRWSLLER